MTLSPPPQSAGPARDWPLLAALLLVATLFRALYALSMPMIAGESYYWLWGQYPAAGYFDHPPLNGWINWLGASGALGSPLAARAPAIFLGALSTLAVYALARELFPAGRTAWRAALLFTITPIFDLNAMFITPDNSLLLAMTLTWWRFWRAAQRPAAWRWALAGVCAGLALLAKFHAWVLLPPLWAFLWISPLHRPLLRSAGPWLAVAVALLVLSPNLIWNAQHDWLNYAFQARRSGVGTGGFELKNVIHYIIGPIATLSPLLYWAILRAIRRGADLWFHDGEFRILFLICAGLPLPLFLGLLTFVTKISLHWPATGYVPLLILAVALIERGLLFNRRYAHAMAALCLAFTALIHDAPLLVMRLPGNLSYALEPLANTSRFKRKFLGWPELGAVVQRQRQALLAAEPEKPALIMAQNWHLTSNLAFYAGSPRETFAFRFEDAHNYRLWMAERDMLRGANAVVVIEKTDAMQKHSRLRKKYDKYLREIEDLFEQVEYAPSLIVYADGTIGEYLGVEITPPRTQEYLIFLCRGWKGELAIGDGRED